jgi:hypothetical protein
MLDSGVPVLQESGDGHMDMRLHRQFKGLPFAEPGHRIVESPSERPVALRNPWNITTYEVKE